MIWIIKGKDLPTLEIIADSFDEALAIARKDNQDYVSGQVKDVANFENRNSGLCMESEG